jgi:hypothetical protein
MARVPLPVAVSEMIARKAVANARNDLFRRGWKSASAMHPYSRPGRIGINSTVKYLLIQNEGFKPFVMWWVKNRTVPLGCAQGDGPHFRFGNPDSVGTPGYVQLPHQTTPTWRPKRWQHPGLKPKRFMEGAISQAIRDSKREIRDTVMSSLKGGDFR